MTELKMKKNIENVEKIKSTQNCDLVEYTKTEEKNIIYGDLELQTDPNISLSVNDTSIINKTKQCKARVISTDNSDQDILDTVARKIQDLNEADSRLASDIRENDEAGKRLIDCIDQHGTQAEVRKLVIHISQGGCGNKTGTFGQKWGRKLVYGEFSLLSWQNLAFLINS